ncbi:hypothetical protein A0J48_011155 [Sphaerospermopsis aphanizomenoides BCCUSP55]|uniref:hypothetical protein n=1 Tax=Sphaerospermopsis aphanizomenoides TaxID=459663 RepID=UPI001907D667|nr:hypothetical protein [Sphaerospermopsis aphanizomenoides]MBK1988089.1 hypothetical protein [Sphaerospermopsis aphanizomenoides BCCUSP55]
MSEKIISEQMTSKQVIKSDLITELSTEEQELLSGGSWLCRRCRWIGYGYGGGGGGGWDG